MNHTPIEMWQELYAPGSLSTGVQSDNETYAAVLPDGHQILLPIRSLPDGSGRGVASLIVNQAAFPVLDALADTVTQAVLTHAPDVVVGLPTLGLAFAEQVARRLGHRRMVPLGTSRKFWYDDALSEPMRSITSPGQHKQLYLDPRMLPLLRKARVLLVDDVLSTGASITAALRLLNKVDVTPVAIGAAMLQGTGWADALDQQTPQTPVLGAIHTPILHQGARGWTDA